ncbi:MAG: creatininase family protein [Candidatus Aerophobus sp.]|nr:MAG: creatininase family protein [Candidatus Aerophobus sp.]
MLLHNITRREGKDKMSEEQVSVVPIGSTEQHGLHAPLGADSIIAEF